MLLLPDLLFDLTQATNLERVGGWGLLVPVQGKLCEMCGLDGLALIAAILRDVASWGMLSQKRCIITCPIRTCYQDKSTSAYTGGRGYC